MFSNFYFLCFLILFTAIAKPFAIAQSETIPQLSPNCTPSGGYAITSLLSKNGEVKIRSDFVDWIKGDVFLMTLDALQVPNSCIFSGKVIGFNEAEPSLAPIAFSFETFDTLAVPSYWEIRGRPEEVTDYSLPLPKVVESISNAKSQLDRSWMQQFITCDAGSFLVTNRMPAESKFFGHPILACLAHTSRGQAQWYTNINGSGCKYGRLRHPDREFDPAQKHAKVLTKETCQQLFLDNQFKPRSDIYSDAVYQMVISTGEKSSKTLSIFDARERENVLYELMLLIRDDFDLLLTDGTSLFFDPHVRGMMLEQALWRPERNPATVTFLLALVMNDLKSSSGELSLSYSLRCAYTNLGFAPNETSHFAFYEDDRGPALSDLDSGAVRARWRYPTEERHVDATVEFIQNAKHITDKLNCVETLILMDKFEHIPPDLMQRWFDEFTVKTHHIRRSLNLLMQNPTGRRYLADKYKAMTADDRLREPIKALFKNELSAVHKSGDYRFFTKEECKQLEFDLQLDFASVTNEKK